MIETMGTMVHRLSVEHLNILLLLGLALFGGTVGGRLFQKLRIPQVVGYIAIGIVLGTSGLKVISRDVIASLQPFSYFALGLIGFMIGGELKKEIFVRHGKQLMSVLFCEGVASFVVVSIVSSAAGIVIFKDVKLGCALGLLLGAISSATAPAATTDVLWEYKTRGPLTRTVLSIVALDDGLALFLFAFSSSIALLLTGHGEGSIFKLLGQPIYEIFGSILVGAGSGFALAKIIKQHTQKEKMLAFSIGAVLLTLGAATALHVDMLLAAMTLGMALVNMAPKVSKKMFDIVEGFTPPIYILFFVLVGAKLDVTRMSLPVIALTAIYLIGRSFGKGAGANLGARISGMPRSVQNYLPFCLFSQAGVAIGLSIVAAQAFPDEIGNVIIFVVTTSTFVVQLIGPPLTKMAVIKANEAGLNITEEDIIDATKVREAMDASHPFVYEHMKLQSILDIFSESTGHYYPVINNQKKLLGVISVDGIRNAFAAAELSNLIVAVDIMEPCPVAVEPDASLSHAKELLDRHHIDYLPVVNKGGGLEGFIERRTLSRFISMRIISLQEQIKNIDNAA